MLLDIVKINLLGPFNRGFYYINNNAIGVGDFVHVEFNRQKVYGVCTDVISIDAAGFKEKEGISADKLKEVKEVLLRGVCDQKMITFLLKVAEYNMLDFGTVLELALPNLLTKKPPKQRSKKDNVNIAEKDGGGADIVLNDEQEKAVANILQNLDTFKVFLINGVTGSGKTHVYIAAMVEVLFKKDLSSQILVLMPEISLTPAVSDGIEKKFGLKIAKWHSSMTPAQKRDSINSIINGEARVIVGARSAVFLPYKNLKMIVIDEEHDGSYKQDETPVYHGRDMSVLRASTYNIPVILTSATPSVESYYNAINGKYSMIMLHQRFGNAKMPEMQVIDLNLVKRIKGGMLSQMVRDEIITTLKQENQVMVFLNRRGYAKMVRCDNCDYVFGCPNCANKLTFHKKSILLKCHYCDFKISKPQNCPSCNVKDSLGDFIPGVEQLKDEVESFAGELAKVSVFSSDEVTGKDGMTKKIAEIHAGDCNVIVGTQIVSKGHNFPNLALVVVVGVDSANNQNDPRIFERLYQLLVQVAGRAGRVHNVNGRVLLQTFAPNHPVLQAILEDDRDKFYQEEIARRKESIMPPFIRQVNIIISSEFDEIAKTVARDVSQSIRLLLKTPEYQGKVGIMGPSESLIYYLKRKYRYTILLDSGKISTIRALIKNSLEGVKISAKAHVKIDVDPYNFT